MVRLRPTVCRQQEARNIQAILIAVAQLSFFDEGIF